FGGQPLFGAGNIDDEAHVGGAADRIHVVAALDLERHGAALDLGQFDVELDLHSHQACREMVDFNPCAHRVFACIQVREQQFAAGDLDVAHQHRGGVDAG